MIGLRDAQIVCQISFPCESVKVFPSGLKREELSSSMWAGAIESVEDVL